MNMSDNKKKEEKKGLLDRFEEAVFPHERKREAAKEEEKAKTEQAEQARVRNERAQADFEARRQRAAAQQGQNAPQSEGQQNASQSVPATGGGAQSGRKHTVKSGETLSHLALKYYGSAAKDEWMKIYQANKEIIGDNPNMIKVGQELVIP
jgi:nucleoid-associated protein YgaU